MRKHRKQIYIMLLMLAITTYFFFSIETKSYKMFSNITYASDGQALDLYVPKDKKTLPVILYVHGGGWSGGDKENVAAKPAFFTQNGYAFLSMNHRLHPDATYEEMAQDVVAAIHWIYEHAAEYKLDRERINLMGHSSGGHLIMLVGTNPSYIEAANLPKNIVQSLVDLDGPVDLESFIERLPKYKKVFGEEQTGWDAASPIIYARRSHIPPTFLVTRKHNSASLQFVETAKQYGNESAFYGYTDMSHSEATKLLGSSKQGEGKEMTDAVLTFLNSYN